MGKEISGTKEWSVESVNCVTGCSHDCRYCYARFDAVKRYKRVKKAADWPNMVVRMKDVRKPRKKAKGTVMFPTTHDITPEVLQPCLRVIENLVSAGNKVLVVTKPHLTCVREICWQMRHHQEQILFRFTIGTMNEAILKYWEPGAPCFSERLRSLIRAFDAGFGTSVSAEPLLDKFGIDMMVELLTPFITDALWIGKMNHVRSRVKIETAKDEEMVRDIELINLDGEIQELYEILRDNPKVKWKESIKKVIGLDLATRAGEDV